ncbi:MAG: hypothetical protein ACI9D5_002368 [Candidatus Endobugula sp.]|jgi:hypothetical protein
MAISLRIILMVLTATVMLSCTSKEEKIVQELTGYHSQVEQKLSALRIHVDKGRLRNILILNTYADVVQKDRPEMRELIDALRMDTTSKGPVYQSLVLRLSEAKKKIPSVAKAGVGASKQLTSEFNSLMYAASIEQYNLMLTDAINVLAGMSNRKLGRINDRSKASANLGVAPPAGSELVGNPTYGSWQSNSSGTSFWAFYGQYAFFSRLFSGPVYYSSWSTNRYPSYYNNAGRNYYTSPSHQQRYQKTEARVKKNYAKQGKSFKSPYAKSSSSTLSGSKLSSTKSSPYNSRSFSSSSRSYSSGGK